MSQDVISGEGTAPASKVNGIYGYRGHIPTVDGGGPSKTGFTCTCATSRRRGEYSWLSWSPSTSVLQVKDGVHLYGVWMSCAILKLDNGTHPGLSRLVSVGYLQDTDTQILGSL